ncbi:MAG: LytR/AlgR family response regulator transcription factor [Cyclobacteriaceae bacterium]
MGAIYKCLIVDDESPAHLVLTSHISNCEELTHAASAYNGKEAIQLLSNSEFDIVFLDINMPLVTGMEVMQTLAKRPATIVTTAYDSFAFDAYQYDAVDYLLKPISFPRFLKAVEKAKHFVEAPPKLTRKMDISFRVNGEVKEIPLQSILYFQSIGNYIKVFLKEQGKTLVVYETLKNILVNTPPDLFTQIHKSYVVNISSIEEVSKDRVVIDGGTQLPLGRKYELLLNKLRPR